MKIFIVAFICTSLGACFGAGIMCLMQIKKDSDQTAKIKHEERVYNEQIK